MIISWVQGAKTKIEETPPLVLTQPPPPDDQKKLELQRISHSYTSSKHCPWETVRRREREKSQDSTLIRDKYVKRPFGRQV